jgi:hypothetical protein
MFWPRIDEAVELIKQDMAFGAAIKTIEDYREKVGVVRGLTMARDLLDSAETKTEERARGA